MFPSSTTKDATYGSWSNGSLCQLSWYVTTNRSPSASTDGKSWSSSTSAASSAVRFARVRTDPPWHNAASMSWCPPLSSCHTTSQLPVVCDGDEGLAADSAAAVVVSGNAGVTSHPSHCTCAA